ncbi:MAG TPA: hypothetical protein VK939_13210 [Longimicrobiales bacterium]|nr:hypothetical protein [Longimicrobiales bacterium]
MNLDPLTQRITELERAFRDFEKTNPGLSVEVVGHVAGHDELVHPVAGFHVRLEPDDGGGGVELYVSASYAELTRWAGAGALREQFNVQLTDGFGWGDSVFPTAHGLAHDLLGYMQFNLDVAAR